MGDHPTARMVRLPAELCARAQTVADSGLRPVSLGIRVADGRSARGAIIRELSRRLVITAALDLGLAQIEGRLTAERERGAAAAAQEVMPI